MELYTNKENNSGNVSKKQKTQNKPLNTKVIRKPKTPLVERCLICKQYSNDILNYSGHPNGAVDEFIALTNEKLLLFRGDESIVNKKDQRPVNKVTSFSVYDTNGHLCPFDTGLISENKLLFFSGYIKAVYEEDSSPNNGIATKDMGPINEWYIAGFNGGEKAIVGFSTQYGEYYLLEPSNEYKYLMQPVIEKITLTKLVIEFLMDKVHNSPTYEDLLQELNRSGTVYLNEETVMRHAQFICDQVDNFDTTADISLGEVPLMNTPCMLTLVQMSGLSCQQLKRKQQVIPFINHSSIRNQYKQTQQKYVFTKATSTRLVREVFESFFNDQLATENTDNKISRAEIQHELKRQRCGICEECLAPDCSKCLSCKKMRKFGGNGKSKKSCRLRKCANMEIENKRNENLEDNWTDNDRLEELSEDKREDCDVDGNNEELSLSKKIIHRNVEWIGDCIEENGIKYYKGAKVDHMTVFSGDYVTLHSSSTQPHQPLAIARITSMYHTSGIYPHMFHANLFIRGSLTVLGECAQPRELFLTDTCSECPLGGIVSRVMVTRERVGSDWSRLGGIDELTRVSGTIDEEDKVGKDNDDKVGKDNDDKVGKGDDANKNQERDDKQSFYYSKKYEATYGRFVDVSKEEEGNVWGVSCCTSCRNKNITKSKSTPKILYDHIAWNDVKYRVGSSVYLLPDTFQFESNFREDITNKNRRLEECSNVDSELYPEYYRKIPDLTLKGSNYSTAEPFCIGIIKEIVDDKMDIMIKVRKMYRPENTHKGIMMTYQKDLNLIYWSEEEVLVPFSKVQGKCYVVYGDSLSIPVRDWSYEGPDRFYFLQSYNVKKKCFEEPPSYATKLGLSRKGNGKGKSLQQPDSDYTNLPIDHPHIPAPLRCLDVFGGCGGLSEGLHQSGVGVTRWAVEREPPAAEAFRLNNPDCDVFTDDCNHVLRYVMDHENDDTDHGYPRKGDVQLLVGGPPCQGFSGMNRFNASQYSLFKNSLIVTYLSYCDYYRPAYFVLENVRNFVTFKKSMVLKLTLRCLLAIGYQVSFGIVQGGHYGIPQTRRRLIIMAAAPGYVLPSFPEPLHVFNKRGCQLAVQIGDHKYTNGTRWTTSAPYRTITIRDALSDLPDIPNGARAATLPYDSDPLTHFQRAARRGQCPTTPVRDHVCKEMTPLVAARMAHVPLAPGSDWRDLPNVEVGLSGGGRTGRLRYGYRSRRQLGGSGGDGDRNKGVCRCSTGDAPCDPADRQFNTLIPWCLPHTGDRHSNWAGLYGRLEWDGFFSTTVTNPEPMGKQGRILHPDQHRVVSVRECARSQGFPDRYKFSGGLMDKHRQIGNAVPPPLGAALGRMICLAYHQTINKNSLD